MIVSKLKDIYLSKILNEQEEIKIFKQEPDEDAVKHVATLDKVYYNNVFKRILKANDLSSEDVDMKLFNSSCKKANVKEGTESDSILFFIKEAGLTFKEENQKSFAEIINLHASFSEKGSLVQMLTESYKGNTGSHMPELLNIIKMRGSTKKGKAVGAGEIFFELFTGGDSADVGDMKLNGETYEIKAMPGARLETERTSGDRKALALKALGTQSLEDLKSIISNMAGYEDNHPGKEELNNGSLDSYINDNKNSILRNLSQRYKEGVNVTQSEAFLNLLGFLQLKCYQQTRKFNYLLAFQDEASDVIVDFVNKDLSVKDLLIKKKYWRFKYDYSEGGTYSTAIAIKSI